MSTGEQEELIFDENDEIESGDYHLDRTFTDISFAEYKLAKHTFEKCVFKSCHFNEMSLGDCCFISCVFEGCDFVLVKLEHTTLNSVRFDKCRLLGINFSGCNKFGFLPDFKGCLLDSTVFCENSLKKGSFSSCDIRNCDFMECDMRETAFDHSVFEQTNFQKCNLEKADFRSAVAYQIDPLNNKLAKARFTLPEAQSFLGFLGITIEY
jgi:uncharacterized protein YjbI with pentapeptide repeats